MKDGKVNAEEVDKMTKQLLHGTELETSDKENRKPKGDAVDGPAHYKGYDVLEIINRYKLPFELGNTVKYILRATAKGKLLEDLKKAKFYLDWYIQRLEKEPVSANG